MTRDLGLDCELRGTTAELVLTGDLDMAAAFKLEPAIERVISQNDVDELVLDLGAVNFIDSAGLGSLLSTNERLNDLGIKSQIKRPSQAVERVLDATGTRDVLIS
jgi:anti-sigma B factor antagonist